MSLSDFGIIWGKEKTALRPMLCKCNMKPLLIEHAKNGPGTNKNSNIHQQ